jgi:hypothetical protein
MTCAKKNLNLIFVVEKVRHLLPHIHDMPDNCLIITQAGLDLSPGFNTGIETPALVFATPAGTALKN